MTGKNESKRRTAARKNAMRPFHANIAESGTHRITSGASDPVCNSNASTSATNPPRPESSGISNP